METAQKHGREGRDAVWPEAGGGGEGRLPRSERMCRSQNSRRLRMVRRWMMRWAPRRQGGGGRGEDKGRWGGTHSL